VPLYEFECADCKTLCESYVIKNNFVCPKCDSKNLDLIGFDASHNEIANPKFLRDLQKKVSELEYRIIKFEKTQAEALEDDEISPIH